jgi:localization factor PodJL
MRYVPWHVKGVRREVREAAARAPRRSGLSVGGWPNSLIIELERAIGALQSLASQVASRDVVAALSSDIKALSDKIDRNSRPAADIQSGRQDGADRRMDELLAQLRELREQSESGLAAIQQQIAMSAADAGSSRQESIRRDVASLKEIQTSVDQRTQGTFEAVYGTIEQMVDRLTAIENELQDRHLAPHPDRVADEPDRCSESAPLPHPPSHAAATTARLRHPAVPDFAPGAFREPDTGARRGRVVANAMDRIAGSEAANGIARRAETSPPVRAKFVAAARRAAQAVVSEYTGTPTGRFEKPDRDAAPNFLLGALFTTLRPRTKSVILGVSMALLMFGALRLALDFFHAPAAGESAQSATRTDDTAERGGDWVRSEQPPPDQPPVSQGTGLEAPASHIPSNANALSDETAPGQAPGRAISPGMAAATAIPTSAVTQTAAAALPPYPPALAGDGKAGATFSPMRDAVFQGTAGHDAASPHASAPDLTATPLPPTIGGKALLAAASAGDPSACYEIAMRFAQGRNTTQDLAMAAAWLARAARSGLAPAQFRLGSMYEKGLGVKKDLAEAGRLYVAAADKGHAKAMHNLAVVYATGLDGKPDYAVASQWFRKAAAYGIVDSQYNLAILYARGAGVERNLAESYKWFALAAKGGDKDAARKRDEVAMRLDPKQLESAKLSAESFVALPQPDEATAIKAPAGGWDQVAAAATTKSKALVTPARFPGR